MSLTPVVRRPRFQNLNWVAAVAFALSLTLLLLAACTPLGPSSKPTAARAANGGTRVASVPDCEGEGENPLQWVSGPSAARGEVEIESEEVDDQEFEVKVKGLDAHTTYIVCVQCTHAKATAKSSGANGEPLPRVAATQASLAIPVVTAPPLTDVIVPVRVQTGRIITYVGFVVDYLVADLELVDVVPGTDAVAQGFTDVSFNSTPPFPPVTTGLDGNVVVQIAHAGGPGTFSGPGTLEIAQMHFRTRDRAGHSSAIAFDRTVPPGSLHTFLEAQPQSTLAGPDSLAFNDGGITIEGSAGPVDCVGFIHTDCDGNGKLELKTEHGDALPCGVLSVCELQSLGGQDRAVEVKLGDENGPVVLRGVVPQIRTEDEDDDHDDDHHDGDDDDHDGHDHDD